MKFKRLIQDYFTFGRNERKGIIALITIVFILALVNRLVFVFERPATIDSELYAKASLKLGRLSDSVLNLQNSRSLFPFNPNAIDSAAADSLDIPMTIRMNLFRYRNKGGMFYSVEDFRKLYGMNDSVFAKIKPFIVIKDAPAKSRSAEEKNALFQFDPNTAGDGELLRLGFTENQLMTFRKYQQKIGNFKTKDDFLKFRGLSEGQKKLLKDYVNINTAENEIELPFDNEERMEINEADSVQLERLPGIGAKLSKRIVKYRDLLGGFYSVDQLKEVYGMSDQTFQRVKEKVQVNKQLIRKIDLNFASKNELGRHPYIGKILALKIIDFRSKYGMIKKQEILKDSMILNMDEYLRLLPYL